MGSIPVFDNARVLVVGDIMLDRYWYGDTGRISPEAPVPVVRIGDEEHRLGGAANVALNLAGIGVATRLLGVVGQDAAGTTVRAMLEAAGVTPLLVPSAAHPTISKLRVLSRNQQLIRLDFEGSFAQPGAFDRHALRQHYIQALAETDVVVCSDYAKGTLVAVDELITAARERGLPVLVDPKGSDWHRYAGASVITPNLQEFERVVGACEHDATLDGAAETLRARLAIDHLVITRSQKGMSVFSAAGHRQLPAQAREVFDVTGAGDTVIALLAAGLAAGVSIHEAATIANLGAGIVVAKLGTATASVAELRRAARASRGEAEPLDETELAARIEQVRAHGERVVMTNGCFDLLHPGHIAYLEAARAYGDWLVVAINDDAGVRRLKGAGRPLNTLDHRARVLRALRAVDWVVAFSEDTPERIIRALTPDVLVKGGDYRPEQIVGGEYVKAAGGQVRVLDFVPGYSTTAMIARMGHAETPGGR